MRTFTNDRSGQQVSTNLSNGELASRFAEVADEGSWLWFWITKLVNERTAAPADPGVQDMMAFLADSFVLAIGMGLKRPMIRLHHKDRRYKIYLSRKGTLCIKTGALVPGTRDPEGDEVYMGCLWGGRFKRADERALLPGDQEVIDELARDPAGFMARCSKDMGRCCYCNAALDDPRSKQVGYGPVCAVRWGLPWGKGYNEAVPSFALLWQGATPEDKTGVRGVCKAIRQAGGKDALLWDVLGDILEGNGYAKRPTCPGAQVQMPAV